MQYRSTRANLNYQLDAPAAIIQGLSPEGGLFVPTTFPKPIFDLEQFKNMSYQEMAKKVLATFFDDFSDGMTKKLSKLLNMQTIIIWNSFMVQRLPLKISPYKYFHA